MTSGGMEDGEFGCVWLWGISGSESIDGGFDHFIEHADVDRGYDNLELILLMKVDNGNP